MLSTWFEWMESGWGYDVLLWFQSWRTRWVSALLTPFHYVGSEFFFIFCIAVLYWLVDKRKGRIIALFFLLTVWLNSWVKILLCRPRPYQVTVPGKMQVTGVFSEGSYGIPSGHTMSTASFFSVLSEEFPLWGVVLLSAFMIFIVPFSRLVHGMHFPQDILFGFLLVYALFIPFFFLKKPFLAAARRWGLLFLIPVGAVVLILLYALPFGALLLPKNNLRSVADSFKLASLFFGGTVGILFEAKQVHFRVQAVFWKRLLRLLFGFLILIGIKLGFDFAFRPFEPAEGANPSFLFFFGEFLEKFLLSFWLTGGAPAVFTLLKLADKEPAAEKV